MVSKVLTINPLPEAGAVTGPDSVCVLATITMIDTTTGGLWSVSNTKATNSGNVFTGVTSGLDTAIYVATNICGTATAIKQIYIKALADAGTIVGADSVCLSENVTLSDAISGGSWSAANGHAVVASGVVTGMIAGSDVISYTVSNSCGTTFTIFNVVINSTPDAGVIVGADTVCTGTSITLTDSSPGGIWRSSDITKANISSGGTVTGVNAGGATITYSVSNFCGNALTIYPIVINTLPAIPSITGSTLSCIGIYDTLVGSPMGGMWTILNANANLVGYGIVNGVNSGRDTLIYSLSNNCGTSSDSFVVFIPTAWECDSILGVNKIDRDPNDGIFIYPNPTTGVFAIELPANAIGYDALISISDNLGKALLVNTYTFISDSKIVLDMGNAARGTYLIKVVVAGNVYRKKLVVW